MQKYMGDPIVKYTLENGLTVLIKSDHRIPKVSLQMWYNVGSKDEKKGQRGLAHLLEHMIFKGTKTLTESDINVITHKLSGYCNAFTSYDYTGYLFDFPQQHWQHALPLLADCMSNCTFDTQMLYSELNAVVQELKMYRDDNSSTLVEEMVSMIFSDHPYHYPIIGYKQDLWNINRQKLLDFYHEHYKPNNAVLVIVGDVDVPSALDLVHKQFDSIPARPHSKKSHYHTSDILARSITLYRDVSQPSMNCAFVIPGATAQLEYSLDVLSYILASDPGSRLYKKLVDELQIATDVSASVEDLFEYGLFFISVDLKKSSNKDRIKNIIAQEINDIITYGVSEQELKRAIKKSLIEYAAFFESTQQYAHVIGQSYIVTGDHEYIYSYGKISDDQLKDTIKNICQHYLRPALMHTGFIEPLKKDDLVYWQELQIQADKLDAKIVEGKTRTIPVQEARAAHTIIVQEPVSLPTPQAQKIILANGLTCLYYTTQVTPVMVIIVTFKAKHYYDPVTKQGLGNFVGELLTQGTTTYPGVLFMQELESYGMSITIEDGAIALSLLANDLERGLFLLSDLLTNPEFNLREIEKVRDQLSAEIDDYWDEPTDFVGNIARTTVYKDHPYSRSLLGDHESINAITHEDLLKYYNTYITPQGTSMAIVGTIGTNTISDLVTTYFGSWSGPSVPDLVYPEIKQNLSQEKANKIIYPSTKDQIVLAFVGPSVARLDHDFYKLYLFDQILTGGVLGSMSSRLFGLRERSGLFYSIGGSLVTDSLESNGMIFIRTLVSQDSVQEAERAIRQTIITAVDTLTEEELAEAKNALMNAMNEQRATHGQLAALFLFLERYNLSPDYFDKAITIINKITVDQVVQAVKKYVHEKALTTIVITRQGTEQ